MPSDGVRERRVALSTNKYMRAFQKTYQLIVDLVDLVYPPLQIEEVLKRFVCIAAIDDYQ